MPKLKPYFKREGNLYYLRSKTPPPVQEPSPEVKAQIFELEKTGAKTLTLDEKGRVHNAAVDPLDLYVAADGPKAASWLIWKHRHRIHARGFVDFQIPADVETPLWFRIAFLFIQRRSKTLAVVMTPAARSPDGMRHYNIQWTKWKSYSPRERAKLLLRPVKE